MDVNMEKTLMGKYELREKLGEGGSSAVYLAWDRHLECMVAVKEQKQPKSMQEETMLKWEREMLKTLKHPMLPAVYDYFGEDVQYLVMEYIKGESLRHYIEKEGSIPEQQACEWAIQLAELLMYLHTRKPPVIYRDLKPENIIVCPDGNLRVVDFGTALLASYGLRYQDNLAGTLGYAAPEQLGKGEAGGAKADERSDIYTLGATLYHMLTGHHPSLPPAGIRALRSMKPELSRRMEQIVIKCTRPEPDKRYQSVEEVKRDLLYKKVRRSRLIIAERPRKTKGAAIRRIEKNIWLTEKKTTGLFGMLILLGSFFLSSSLLSVKGRETPLPVVVYNEQGQKVVIRYDSVYQPDGNLLLELGHELFDNGGIWELSVGLKSRGDGQRRERVFYIQGDG